MIDLEAIASNLGRTCQGIALDDVMAVVKADGYGHGMVPVARTAREVGAG
ncbi:MAG: alanine racemase, partial [Actinomycetales bacterium]